MTTPSDGPDRPGDQPQPQPWDAPPQPPAWDRPADPSAAGHQQSPGGQPWGQPPAGAQAWGPPPGYGQPAGPGGHGYGAPQSTDTKAVVGLVFAIGSFVVCPVLPAIVALFLASSSQRDIDASGGRLGGTGLNRASKIVSWINIGLALLGALAVGLVVALGSGVTTSP